MKKTYLNPELSLLVIADEDVITTSPITSSTNLAGDDDGALLNDMFK